MNGWLKSACVVVALLTVLVFAWPSSASAQATEEKTMREQAAEKMGKLGEKTGEAAKDVKEEVEQKWGEMTKKEEAPAKPSGVSMPAGVEAQPIEDAEPFRDVLAAFTMAPFSDDGIEDTLEQVSSADHERISEEPKPPESVPKEYAAKVDQFKKDWKQRFNQDFDMKDEKEIYSDLKVAGGRVTDPAKIDKWPVVVMEEKAMEQPGGKMASAKPSIEVGKDVALVQLPAHGDVSAMTVSMVRDMPAMWKIDIPDNVTGDMIRKNIMEGMDRMSMSLDKWDAKDPAAGYRMVTACMLKAVYGMPAADKKMSKEGMTEGMKEEVSKAGEKAKEYVPKTEPKGEPTPRPRAY